MKNMISIIVPNYNGVRFLPNLFASLEEQTYSNFEVVVVDNASHDGSDEWLKSKECKLIILDKNYGFAKACNEGAKVSAGDGLFFLNSDTLLDKRCIEMLVRALKEFPSSGFFAPKMVRMFERDVLDGVGDIFPRDGRPKKRGEGAKSAMPFSDEVFSPTGGAVVWRRDVFESLSGFDEDFFAYLEDVDLGFRARLSGIRGRYVYQAIVYHFGAGVQSESEIGEISRKDAGSVVRWVARNKIWLWAKCLPIRVFVRLFPFLFMGLLKSALYHIFLSRQGIPFVLGTIEGIVGIPRILKKRGWIQASRKVSDREIYRWIIKMSRSLS